MKLIIIVSCLAMVYSYTDINDKYNWQALLEDKKRLGEIYRCFIDQAPCSDIGTHIKVHMMEMTHDGCTECDSVQKHWAHIFTNAMKVNFPEIYRQYKAKYDPNDIYLKQFEKEMEKY